MTENLDDRHARARAAQPPAGDAQPIFNVPAVVVGTAAVLVACFLGLRALPEGAANALEWNAAVAPRRFVASLSGGRGPFANIATLASHMLLHSGLLHIAVNSLWLIAFGSPVARRLGAHERRRADLSAIVAFLALFTLSGVAGALFYVALHADSAAILIGASGGVSGLLGALVRFAFDRNPGAGPPMSPLNDRTVVIWSISIVAMNVIFGLVGPALGFGRANVAWEAHIGGYIFGLLTFPLFARAAGR